MKKIAIIFCSVFVLLVIIISTSYFSNAKKILRNEVKKDLKVIAKIKAGQIVNWYADEMIDAGLITENQLLIEKINEFSGSGNPIHQRTLIQFFETLRKEHGYANISLFSKDNQLLFQTKDTPPHNENIVKQAVGLVSQTNQLTTTGIYTSENDQNVYIGIVSPVHKIGSDEAIAIICFSIDINKQLYPTIISSLLPWDSYETILLYRKNDTIVYLNHLISNSNTSSGINTGTISKFRDSISTRALTGFEGIIEGRDYRGNEVISFVCPLKGTDWFLMAKINSGEIEGSMHGEVTLLIIITILLSLLSIAAVAYLYNYRQKGLYKELYLKRQESRATLYSIGDAVITTDKKGLIILMNNIAEQLTGWKETEARGKHLDKVFVIINEYTGKTVESPVNKVINTGAIVGLANHTLLVSKHGEEIPIADSGAPIQDENGDISGVVLVFRDQTEQRIHQKLLEASEAKYRELIESTDAIAWEYNIEKDQWTYVAPQVTDKLGWLPEEWVNLEFWKNNIHPDERELSADYCIVCTAKGESHTLEYRFMAKDGSYVWLRDVVSVEPKNNKPYKLRGVMLDISELKNTELQLREREYFLSESQKIAQIGSYFFDIVNYI
ncbi:MAG: PAS domain S-box protein, partial [Bacteroidales bacterium]|nr:PAS domain S-box protein [Bacteroidales bacterium]